MRDRSSLRLVCGVVAGLGIVFLGCEPLQSPSSEVENAPVSAPKMTGASADVVAKQPAVAARRATPGRPFKGTIGTFKPIWFVSHVDEQQCDGTLFAGTDADVAGNFSHMGKTEGRASAAWDWSVAAPGTYSPEGPSTGTSASIVDSYPYEFCTADGAYTAHGQVVLARKNGDELHGEVVGGEVYELGLVTPGDAQEQFIEVAITGGTGRFQNASGSFVFHAILHFVGPSLIKGEILEGGRISY